MRTKLLVLVACTTAALVFAGLAQAHVTVHPNALPSGGYVVVDIRVPNERPTANTTRVDVKLPAGFYSVSTEAVPGWKAAIVYRRLAKPVTVNGQTQAQEVDHVIYTGKLPPKQFVQFPLSVAVPKVKAGTILTFKALQTYSNGEIVRWIGPPGAATPAPQVKVIGADSPVADYPGGVSTIKRTTRLGGSPIAQAGAVGAMPLLGLAGIGLRRRRRRRA